MEDVVIISKVCLDHKGLEGETKVILIGSGITKNVNVFPEERKELFKISPH